MNATEIKQYIEANSDDSEVKSLVDSLADRRVNQAKQTWERELPQRIDTEIAARQEREQAQQDRRAYVGEQLGERFTEARLDPDWAEPFLPIDLADIEDEQIDVVAQDVIKQVQDLRNRFLNDRYSGTTPKGGGASEQKDPKVSEFRRSLGLTD